MEWSKVKNIIILMLLLVNGFLLVLVVSRQEQSQRYQDSALIQSVQVLERSGIQVNQDGLEQADQLASQSVMRDLQEEARLAQALLGETVQAENQGGGIYTYTGSRGQVSLRPSGALSAQLDPAGGWQTDDAQSQGQELLEAMGIQARLVDSQLDQGSGTVRFQQLWQGAPLFSSQVDFIYQDGRLSQVEGTLLISGGEPAAEEETVMDLPTALLRFLEGVLDSGQVCSAIQSMQAGYLAQPSYSGAVSLRPVWLVSSNTADYYLDGVTGELTRLEGT